MLPAIVCLALAACAQKTETTSVYTETLPGSGVTLTIENCEVAYMDEVAYIASREEQAWRQYFPGYATSNGVPLLTLSGVSEDEVEFLFVEDIDYLMVGYDRTIPAIYIDYELTETQDGVQYRLDTVYNYQFTVTTEQGSDTFFVMEDRTGLE